jgi:hypothetical protein
VIGRTSTLSAALSLVLLAACDAGSGSSDPFHPATAGASGSSAGASGSAGSSGSAGASGSAGSGGSAGTSGSAGATGAAGSGTAGSSGAAGSGSAGASGSSGASGATGAAGASGAAGATAAGDTPAWREMMVTDATRHSVKFSAKAADPGVSDPTSHLNDNQSGDIDTSKPLKKKLCVVLPGIGNGPGQGIGFWAAGQGYHVFSVAYSNAIGAGDGSADAMGNTRMNQFDGKGRTPAAVNTTRSDSIEGRVIAGLKYLQEKDPEADWAWYLNQAGTEMRWSDGCFIGYSYGATHLAVIARYVRIGLGVSTSGPQSEGHPDSTWLKIPSATPVERLFAIWGSSDEPAMTDNGYKSHYTVTTGLLGYTGNVVHTSVDAPAGTPPYTGSHRLSVDGQGHTEFCASGHPYCSYMFGL